MVAVRSGQNEMTTTKLSRFVIVGDAMLPHRRSPPLSPRTPNRRGDGADEGGCNTRRRLQGGQTKKHRDITNTHRNGPESGGYTKSDMSIKALHNLGGWGWAR